MQPRLLPHSRPGEVWLSTSTDGARGVCWELQGTLLSQEMGFAFCATWPGCVLPAPSDGWLPGMLQGVVQGSWLSSVRFELRHLYQMSFYQVAVSWFLEKTSGFSWH